MVFENVTLFELHLENSRFSATRGAESEEDTESYEVESGEESSGRGFGRVLGVLVFLVVVGLAVRRFRSGGEGEEYSGAGETEDVSIEQAAEQ